MNGTMFSVLSEFDELNYRLDCGVSMVGAVHDCLESGGVFEESYKKALFGAYLYMSSLQKELSELIESGMETARNM